MRFFLVFVAGFLLVGANAFGPHDFAADLDAMHARERQREHVEEIKHEHGHRGDIKLEVGQPKSSVSSFKLDDKNKKDLLKDKEEKLLARTELDFFLKNPNTLFERECFAKFRDGESVDFVIDIASSPSHDDVDRRCAESPLGLYLEGIHRSATRAYFDAIAMFVEASTIDMKPECTHVVIFSRGSKYFIRGKYANQSIHEQYSEFVDRSRNLKTLWPEPTKTVPETYLSPILVNNLGHLTRHALWSRDNGLPSVMFASRRSKPIYTIVITDGSSGAKIHDLTDDLERTTVIDIGDRRFVNRLSWEDMSRLVKVVTLPAPQALPTLIDTTRMLACRLCIRK